MAVNKYQANTTSNTNAYAIGEGKDKSLVSDIYRYTKDFRDVTEYNLMRGVPDFGNLMQFTPYETGYAVFIICAIPAFMEKLAEYNEEYAKIIANWKHIIEYEFKSFDGLSGITADTLDIGDDLNRINIINKVNMESTQEFSLTYDEKSGSPITKFNKLYLTGIKDPRTQVKTYHGLIHKGIMEPGFENEVFTFLFINTDNTMRYVEFSMLLIAGQINTADLDMYGSYTKGDIAKREVTVKFNAYPIMSSKIDSYAQQCLDYLVGDGSGESYDADGHRVGITLNSMDYDYTKSVTAIESLYNDKWGKGDNIDYYAPNSLGSVTKLSKEIEDYSDKTLPVNTINGDTVKAPKSQS